MSFGRAVEFKSFGGPSSSWGSTDKSVNIGFECGPHQGRAKASKEARLQSFIPDCGESIGSLFELIVRECDPGNERPQRL